MLFEKDMGGTKNRNNPNSKKSTFKGYHWNKSWSEYLKWSKCSKTDIVESAKAEILSNFKLSEVSQNAKSSKNSYDNNKICTHTAREK